MSQLGGLLGIIIGLFGFVSFIAAAVAVARASYAKATVEALRGDRDDLQARVVILENENVRINTELETEKAKTKVLEGITVGKEQLARIEELLKALDKNFSLLVDEMTKK